jgi:hypothetical protein
MLSELFLCSYGHNLFNCQMQYLKCNRLITCDKVADEKWWTSSFWALILDDNFRNKLTLRVPVKIISCTYLSSLKCGEGDENHDMRTDNKADFTQLWNSHSVSVLFKPKDAALFFRWSDESYTLQILSLSTAGVNRNDLNTQNPLLERFPISGSWRLVSRLVEVFLVCSVRYLVV